MMKNLALLLIAFLGMNSLLLAKDYKVFFIKKEFDMGIPGKTLEKDYYINMGVNQGVVQGTILNVYRAVSVMNSEDRENKTIDAKILVGQLKAIFVQDELTVARLTWLSDFDNTPVATFHAVMIGDYVEVGKKKETNKTASTEIKETKENKTPAKVLPKAS